MSEDQHSSRLTRRGVLAAGGVALLGAAGGYAAGTARASGTTPIADCPAPDAAAPTLAPRAGYFGAHQPGVSTKPTQLQAFVGLDLRRSSREDADAVMRLVTDDAARLALGEPVLGDTQPELAAGAGGVSVTVGLGHSLFDRLGLADAVPACFPVLPSFATDSFEPPWSGTDLLLQVGADDPVVLSHALRVLDRDLSTLARRRWTQRGFRSPEPAVPGSDATRNLMGQVDGTVNPRGSALDDVVWIDDGPPWVRGGTVLVLRRIRMLLDDWDLLDRAVQESVIGRRLDTGAPLGRVAEDDSVPLDAIDDLGLPVIPHDAHVRVAHAATAAESVLRRPYNYDDGPPDGPADVGLIFAAYTRDPTRSYIPMQQRIADADAFNRWNTTIGSATYLIPAGVAEGSTLAEGLFA